MNNSRHLCFPFTTKTLNDLLSFSIYLLDDNNKQITIVDGEKKYSKLSNRCVFTMNRKLRPARPTQQIKEEQINFLLEDAVKNWKSTKKLLN